MTTMQERTAGLILPERLGGQGLDENQYESGDRAIQILLTDETVGPQTDLAITYRDGAYEVWAQRGMMRFERTHAHAGGYEYRVVEQAGENPLERQDPQAVSSIDEEVAASRASGFPGDDANAAYVEPQHVTYPLAYERIAQLFDSPNAPSFKASPLSVAHSATVVTVFKALFNAAPGAELLETCGPSAKRFARATSTIAHAVAPRSMRPRSRARPPADMKEVPPEARAASASTTAPSVPMMARCESGNATAPLRSSRSVGRMKYVP